MRRFIYKIIIFSVPLIVCAICSEYILRSIPNNYSYKANFLESSSADSIKILNLGSSHAIAGIEPTEFVLPAFNGAHFTQTIDFDRLIFDKYVNKLDSLKYLILPISYFSMYSKLENGVERRKVKEYVFHYDCNRYPYSVEHNFKLYDYNSKLFKDLVKYVLFKSNNIECTKLGFTTQYHIDKKKDNWKNTGEIAAKRHTNKKLDVLIYNENIRHVTHIINKCNDKNITVILLTTPTHALYRQNLNEEQLRMMYQTINHFDSLYSNVLVLDYFADDDFSDDDFSDVDHLNNFGAVKLTKRINDQIMINIKQ